MSASNTGRPIVKRKRWPQHYCRLYAGSLYLRESYIWTSQMSQTRNMYLWEFTHDYIFCPALYSYETSHKFTIISLCISVDGFHWFDSNHYPFRLLIYINICLLQLVFVLMYMYKLYSIVLIAVMQSHSRMIYQANRRQWKVCEYVTSIDLDYILRFQCLPNV